MTKFEIFCNCTALGRRIEILGTSLGPSVFMNSKLFPLIRDPYKCISKRRKIFVTAWGYISKFLVGRGVTGSWDDLSIQKFRTFSNAISYPTSKLNKKSTPHLGTSQDLQSCENSSPNGTPTDRASETA